MTTSSIRFQSRLIRRAGAAAVFCASALVLDAQAPKRNPTSKVYVSDLSGEAVIDTGEAVYELGKRAVYNAQGSVIETKPPLIQSERKRSYSTMVYSNGTGAFFDADTRVEVRQFSQEPFLPTRTDMDVEPSISQTQAYVARGAVGLCTSKLVAGSTMIYQTPHGAVNIRGRKVVIEASPEETKISMIEGESTVRAGPLDSGGHAIRAGEQAIIRSGGPGQPNSVKITRIPPAEAPMLDDKVTMACMAKRTVYFEVKEVPPERVAATAAEAATEPAKSADSSGDAVTPSLADTFAGGAAGSPVASTGPVNVVTAFDGNSAPPTPGSTGRVQQIVAVPVMPANLPVSFTISPASVPLGP